MSQRNRDLEDEVKQALGGEGLRPRSPAAHSGHSGVAVAGNGNTVHYHGAHGGPYGAGGGGAGAWKRVWALLALPIFLAGMWLQIDQAAWQAAAGEPGVMRLGMALAQGNATDVVAPAIAALAIAGALALALRWWWLRR